MKQTGKTLSVDELIRQGVVPPVPKTEDLDFLPPSNLARVVPPIDTGPESDDSLVELSSRSFAGVPGSMLKKRRRLFGFAVPCKYEDLSWYEILARFLVGKKGLGSVISLIFHLLLFMILAMIVFQTKTGTIGESIEGVFAPQPGDLEVLEESGNDPNANTSFEPMGIMSGEITLDPVSSLAETDPVKVPDLPMPLAAPGTSGPAVSETPVSLPVFSRSGITKGRNGEGRKQGLPGRKGDTNKASEDAVERGLIWLVEHQLPDGGWSFDLSAKDRNGREGKCGGRCSNTHSTLHDASHRTGLHPSRSAATALALLSFFGAGYTHTKENPYQKTIQAGIDFIKYQAVQTEDGYDYRGAWIGQGMYIQGITVLMLAEALEMSGDDTLRTYAQEGVRFIENAQRSDGGWRYHIPKDTDFIKDISGDTAVSGWQFLALKSALSAGLSVRPEVIYKVGSFLDLVQNRDGSMYHYLPIKNEIKEDKMNSTTAIGLLIRQYLGWRPDHATMKKGVGHLVHWIDQAQRDWQAVKKGQTKNGDRELISSYGEKDRRLFVYNLYYSFYAMLVLQNNGGSDWKRSFQKTRDFLVETQQKGRKAGHEDGSWLFRDLYLDDGGRLLNTVFAILILETPYRYLPLYNTQ
ncbi:MAG: hypothetical protein Q4G69_03185 [Planctomycetia bacterium]|nr:hypothetical protein [Planctomycetia bacterium]